MWFDFSSIKHFDGNGIVVLLFLLDSTFFFFSRIWNCVYVKLYDASYK